MEDPFDSVINAENRYGPYNQSGMPNDNNICVFLSVYEAGFEAGLRHGKVEGRIDGFRTGHQKGLEFGDEVLYNNTALLACIPQYLNASS